jgi:hypothetical protein
MPAKRTVKLSTLKSSNLIDITDKGARKAKKPLLLQIVTGYGAHPKTILTQAADGQWRYRIGTERMVTGFGTKEGAASAANRALHARFHSR